MNLRKMIETKMKKVKIEKTLCFLPILCLVLCDCGSKKITQQEFGNIAGEVYAIGAGSPIPGVLVSCSGVVDTTDSSGAYSLLSVPVGMRSVTASKEGYDLWKVFIEVRKGSNALDIHMNSTAPIDKGTVFYSQRTDGTQLFVMDSDGLTHEQITYSCHLYVNTDLFWVDDKQKIAFAAWLDRTVVEIVVISSNGTVLDTIDSGCWPCVIWDVSPGEERLLYEFGGEPPKPLQIINVDGTGEVVLNLPYDGRGAGFCGSDKVVYTETRNVFTINIDGTGKEQLSDSVINSQKPYYYYLPVGSPDGSRIAFGVDFAMDCPHYALGIMNSDGSEDTLLAFEVGRNRIMEIEFSPDGQKILYLTSEYDNSEIFVINVDGTGLDSLTGGIACWDGGACWSPDGNWIAFTSNRKGNKDIYKVSVDGKILVQLTDDIADDFCPDW